MAEIIEAGSITLDKEPSRIVDAGSIELDKPTQATGPTIQSWKGPSLTDKFFSLFDNPGKEQAKAVEALVNAEALKIKPSTAYHYRDAVDTVLSVRPDEKEKRNRYMSAIKKFNDTGVEDGWSMSTLKSIAQVPFAMMKAAGGILQAFEEHSYENLEAYAADRGGYSATDLVGVVGKKLDEKDVRSIGREFAKKMSGISESISPNVEPGSLKDYVNQATISTVNNLAYIAPAIITKNPVPMLTLMGLQAGGEKRYELREAGISPWASTVASLVVGTSEGLTEKIPLSIYMKPQKQFTKRLVESLFTEMPTEQVNTLVETVVDKVTVNPDMSLQDYINRMVTTAYVTALSTGQLTAGSHMLHRSMAKSMPGDLKSVFSNQANKTLDAGGTVQEATNQGMAAVTATEKGARFVEQKTQELVNEAKRVAPGLAGIAALESGGKYTAEHPTTKAYGKYQIMPSNWGPWAKEAGLSADAPMTPENQETVANFKWNQYMERFGGNDQLAATAWFAGPGAAQRLMNGDTTVLSKSDANGTTVEQYIAKTTGREFGAEGTAQAAVNIDKVITRAIETDDDIDQIANDFFAGMVTEEGTQTQEQGINVPLEGIAEDTPTVMAPVQENVTTGQADANLTAIIMDKAKAINETLGNKGSIDLTPVVELGRSVYQQGARTYEQFSARVKELVGDAWEKVKDLVRQAWDVISNESGKISFDKKDKSGKIKDASQQTPSETGPESIATMEGAEKDAVSAGYNKAEAEAVEQLKQSQSFEEFEKTIEKADFGDTSMESPLERGMTLPELKAYRKSIAENPQIEKMKAAIQSYRSALKELGKKMKMANKDEVASLKGQIRELKATREDIKKSYSSVKARIREITGQTKGPKTVTEYDALKASFVKAAQAARVAYRAGNKEGVEKAKATMRDALSRVQEKKAQAFQKAKDIKAIKKLTKMKGSIAVDYQKKIRDLMEGIDFKNITPAKWEQLKGLQDFIESEGVPLGINPKRLDELKRLTAIPLKSLDNEQIAMLRKQLEELTALGKLKASLKYKYNERKRAELEKKILGTTRNLDPSVQFQKGKMRFRDKMKVAIIAMYLNTMHTPRVADLADGYQDYKGEQARLIKKSGEAETRAVANATNRQQAWLDYLKENNITLPVEGSESDIRMNIVIRMREGATKQTEMLMEHYGVKEIPVLTHEEEKIVEYIRQDMERNKAKLAATWEEINGEIFPEQKVYYLPLKYQGEEELLPETQTEGRGRTTHTFDGFRHARRPNVKKLPKVGIAQLYQDATMEQEWFTGLQPIVEDIKSVVLTPEYKEAAGSVLYDWWKTQLDIMSRRGWTASAQMTALSSALAEIRHNITTATLAFKLTTVIMQPMAVFDAMSYVNSHYGPVAAAKVAGAVTESFLRPGWTKGIIEGSEALKQRAGGELAIQEELSRLDDTVMDKVKRAGFNMIQWTDIKTAAGVQEQVRKILLAEGMNEDEALKEAEFVMHLSQGSTSVAYRPHILAQGEGYRTWFTFQNFVLNRWGVMIHDIVNGKIINGKGISARILGMVSLGILVAGGMAEDEARRKVKQIYTSPKEDKRSMFEQIIVNVLGAIPFFGSIVTAVSQKFDAQPPTISHVQNVLEGGFQTIKGKDAKSKAKGGLKLSEALITILLGIPGTGQVFDLIEAGVNKKSDDRRNR